MFGLGFGEIVIILFIALLFIGPKKLPELAKSLGKGLREFKKATNDFSEAIKEESQVQNQITGSENSTENNQSEDSHS
jgi:sec-independent protein translocase protein TatA